MQLRPREQTGDQQSTAHDVLQASKAQCIPVSCSMKEHVLTQASTLHRPGQLAKRFGDGIHRPFVESGSQSCYTNGPPPILRCALVHLCGYLVPIVIHLRQGTLSQAHPALSLCCSEAGTQIFAYAFMRHEAHLAVALRSSTRCARCICRQQRECRCNGGREGKKITVRQHAALKMVVTLSPRAPAIPSCA